MATSTTEPEAVSGLAATEVGSAPLMDTSTLEGVATSELWSNWTLTKLPVPASGPWGAGKETVTEPAVPWTVWGPMPIPSRLISSATPSGAADAALAVSQSAGDGQVREATTAEPSSAAR